MLADRYQKSAEICRAVNLVVPLILGQQGPAILESGDASVSKVLERHVYEFNSKCEPFIFSLLLYGKANVLIHPLASKSFSLLYPEIQFEDEGFEDPDTGEFREAENFCCFKLSTPLTEGYLIDTFRKIHTIAFSEPGNQFLLDPETMLKDFPHLYSTILECRKYLQILLQQICDVYFRLVGIVGAEYKVHILDLNKKVTDLDSDLIAQNFEIWWRD